MERGKKEREQERERSRDKQGEQQQEKRAGDGRVRANHGSRGDSRLAGTAVPLVTDSRSGGRGERRGVASHTRSMDVRKEEGIRSDERWWDARGVGIRSKGAAKKEATGKAEQLMRGELS